MKEPLSLTFLIERHRGTTRATARVPALHLLHPRPYHDRPWGADSSVVIVRAGVVWMWGGDPCGRPRPQCVKEGKTLEEINTLWAACGRPRPQCVKEGA